MGTKVVFALLLLRFSAHCVEFEQVFGYPPEVLWEQTSDDETQMTLPELRTYKHAKHAIHHHDHHDHHGYQTFEAPDVSVSVPISAGSDHMHLLKPEWSARPLPELLRRLLLAKASVPPPHHHDHHDHHDPHHHCPHDAKTIEVLCHIDRIYVRVKKDIFTSADAYKDIKLGSCVVNQGTDEHYYLLYLIKDCDTEMQSDSNSVTFTNKVSYMPASSGPIVREMRFNIPLECRYNRFHLSYNKHGFMPTLQGGTVHKHLNLQSSGTLDVYDMDGKELPSGESFAVGQPMVFEVKAPSNDWKQMVYLNKCFITASRSYNSMPKYTVIDNSGCVVDDQSKFISRSAESTKFTVNAFIFEQMAFSSTPTRMYMHCEVAMGPLTPTPSAKSCDRVNHRWVEVNSGHDHVCYCCSSSCPSVQPAARSMITSKSLKVENWSGHQSFGNSHVVETIPELKMTKIGKVVTKTGKSEGTMAARRS